jgi:hypothetical protein
MQLSNQTYENDPKHSGCQVTSLVNTISNMCGVVVSETTTVSKNDSIPLNAG